MTRHRLMAASLIVLLAFVVSACGGDDDPGTGPSGGGGGGGGGTGGTVAATITITAAGVSPQNVTVAAGFARDVRQQRHPAARHGVGSASRRTPIARRSTWASLQPGQSGTTQNLNTVRTCGFHDHTAGPNTSLQGTIRIQ